MPVLVLFLLIPIASPAPRIDIFLFETQAARALLQGLSPYDITFADVGLTGMYPGGDPDAYPYPPLSLLFATVGNLFGDVRWSLIASHVLATGLLFATARKRLLPTTEALALAALFCYMPYAPFVSEQAWTEPGVALGLGSMSVLLAHRRPLAALWAAGFAVALKLAMLLLLPLLWASWRRLDRSHLAAVFSFSAVTYGAFLLWDAGALWNDVFQLHLHAPFRPQSLTLSAYLVHFFDWSPLPSWLCRVGIVVGVAAAVIALCVDTGQDSPCDSTRVWRLYAGLGFAMLLTIILSKQAFLDDYYLVHYCLLGALVWSRVADHEAATDTDRGRP